MNKELYDELQGEGLLKIYVMSKLLDGLEVMKYIYKNEVTKERHIEEITNGGEWVHVNKKESPYFRIVEGAEVGFPAAEYIKFNN